MAEPTARAVVDGDPPIFRFEGENTADTQLRSVDLAGLGAGPHILHGGTLGMFRGPTAETLADLAVAHLGLVSIDPNVRPQIISDRHRWHHFHGRWRQRADIYKVSAEDAEWIWPRRAADAVAAELLDGAASVVAVTHGHAGATIYVAGEEIRVPGVSVVVVDTVGAGDTFVGSLLTSIWERWADSTVAGSQPTTRGMLARIGAREWHAIGEQAVQAAAIACTRVGADPPRKSELPGTT